MKKGFIYSFGLLALLFAGCDNTMDLTKSDEKHQETRALAIPETAEETSRSITSAPTAAPTPKNWMGFIEDTRSLSNMTIPGTHDSAADHEHVYGTAKCHDLSIAGQLNSGVRFLDIRCRHIGTAFAIHHGVVFQHKFFGDVLNDCYRFLAENPTETIIMSVKEEHDPEGTTRSFEETFESYINRNISRWYLENRIPTMGEARGKIVLVRRFGARRLPKGIRATSGWGQNATMWTGHNTVRIQDKYSLSFRGSDKKWDVFSSMLTEAKGGPESTMYLNYSSGYESFFGIPIIYRTSDYMNPRILNYFQGKKGRYGVIIMDYIEEKHAKAIYNTNL